MIAERLDSAKIVFGLKGELADAIDELSARSELLGFAAVLAKAVVLTIGNRKRLPLIPGRAACIEVKEGKHEDMGCVVVGLLPVRARKQTRSAGLGAAPDDQFRQTAAP